MSGKYASEFECIVWPCVSLSRRDWLSLSPYQSLSCPFFPHPPFSRSRSSLSSLALPRLNFLPLPPRLSLSLPLSAPPSRLSFCARRLLRREEVERALEAARDAW
eukprot:4093844-Pleurochrysis_carterae.AAC.1